MCSIGPMVGLRLFKKDADFAAFEQVLAEAFERVPLRILGYTVMGNHWHFIVWPKPGQHQQVSEFFRWLTVTHSQRWHAHHGTAGMGHVYQGRFKSFPIAADEHLLTVLRYVERNPLRAGLVERAEDGGGEACIAALQERRKSGPCLPSRRCRWADIGCEHVNAPQTEAELAAIRRSVVRGQPFGGEAWAAKVARQMGLEHTFRPRGRPQESRAYDDESERPENDSRPL